jgi:hypothetical protein
MFEVRKQWGTNQNEVYLKPRFLYPSRTLELVIH